MNSRNRKKIFVGLSGGVDSSVAALRLLRARHDVTGVFIKVWQPDFIECDWERERLDAMRVAAHLGIPFLTFDAEAVYMREVAEYMVAEYKAGRTPNPDVMCNKHVKFGVFLDFARQNGADAIATGHYVRKSKVKSHPEKQSKARYGTGKSKVEHYQLLRGADPQKDQSYFLWTLTSEELAHSYFPVGDSTKAEIRKEAADAGLPTAAKRDSQGICFLGSVDLETFLSHFTALSPGPILDRAGETVGTHRGALIYTIGQRHGFSITDAKAGPGPYYITAKDVEQNTITVSHERPRAPAGGGVTLESINMIEPWMEGEAYEGQMRYRQTAFPVRVESAGNSRAMLSLSGSAELPVAGQSCVLYRGEQCLGGGIVAH